MSTARRLSRTRWIAILPLIGGMLTGLAMAGEPEEPTVGSILAPPGETVSGYLEVPAGAIAGTRIPITVVHGTSAGPVLALIAGTHGYEYPPILALQQLRRELDPAAELSGSVILVHVANLPSFLGRTIYYSPIDGKNLNRVYPAEPTGTAVTASPRSHTQVIERADYVADMHCGDGNEALSPYLYLTVTGDADLDERSKALGLAFGLDTIVVQGGWTKDTSAHVYTEWAALGRGKAAITTETGSLGSTSHQLVSLAEKGVWNLLRHLGMLEVSQFGHRPWCGEKRDRWFAARLQVCSNQRSKKATSSKRTVFSAP